jgi:hypothetical protein
MNIPALMQQLHAVLGAGRSAATGD